MATDNAVIDKDILTALTKTVYIEKSLAHYAHFISELYRRLSRSGWISFSKFQMMPDILNNAMSRWPKPFTGWAPGVFHRLYHRRGTQ